MTDHSKNKQPVIELEDVWKIYTMGEVEVAALRGLSLKIYRESLSQSWALQVRVNQRP